MKYILSLVIVFCSTLVYATPDNIYLFRHSEKGEGENPHLTTAGEQRAKRLPTLIADTPTVTLYSTNYNRTLESAGELAKHFAVEINIYDPRDLVAFKRQVLQQEGTVIVIGHSNTSVQLAAIISEGTVRKMPESEFLRYFLLQRTGKSYHLSDLRMNF
ncbi:histidine phosphatase family protein [Pseudoalteromonas shioyasakiensis]|uniref:histidine phosphatase family protein n=1 Tax=Pseudoalteromonas shioyasakiensis TaxID=1190813 RepID=UPI002117B2D6|nr:histidine phosphatase family protein [Pseudoalteromonas shioyasakiensis]MCQ8877311.1 histidine phosphatase family protein [Pseudoalteromonas shioyasakiensis]